jgi:hypothetical protein
MMIDLGVPLESRTLAATAFRLRIVPHDDSYLGLDVIK